MYYKFPVKVQHTEHDYFEDLSPGNVWFL